MSIHARLKNSSTLVVHGDQMIGPEKAKWIIENCFYAPQEARRKTGKLNVQRILIMMRRGRWIPGSQITFARLPNGKLYRVNGYHRTDAVIEFGKELRFNVQIIDCANDDAVDSLYSSFDRSIGTRQRSFEQAANALHFADKIGVSKQAAKGLHSAVALIHNGLRPIMHGHQFELVEIEALEDRLDAALPWKSEAAELDAILYRANVVLKRKLLAGPIFAVALITMRYQREKAKEYWARVASNDGLRRGTPEHSFVQRLLTDRMESHSEKPFQLAALPWNAFYYGRPLTQIKTDAPTELRIAGTPYGKGTR